MIIANDLQGLQPHQQDAYKAVQEAYQYNNKASVVMPTGCGKSFVSLQLMADNKDKNILFLAPTRAIRNQMYNYIAEYIVGIKPVGKSAIQIAEEYFPHLKIHLYPALLRIPDQLLEKIQADFIIMDELHRTGADKWGERVNTLLDKNPNAKILGLTATPDRMDDINIIDNLFEGTINYELTLVEALRNRIVKTPKYVKCDYALDYQLENVRSAIDNCYDEQTKKELEKLYEKMRRIVDNADDIPELFRKNIEKKDGKYIVFCKDKQHMDELINKVNEWFGSIDSEPEIYSVYSGEGYTDKENSNTIKNFENSKSQHLKLLFSVDMLNEGLHVENISGVIMARPTSSRLIYLQQLGRALSSDPSKDQTIVFDLVNNYLTTNLDYEINHRQNGLTSNNKSNFNTNVRNLDDYDIEDIGVFRIQGETKDFIELLSKVMATPKDESPYLVNARLSKEWMKTRNTTKPPTSISKNEEEKKLGISLNNIRQLIIKPYRELQTEDKKAKYIEDHPDLPEILEIIKWIDDNNISPSLVNTKLIKEWMETRNTTKPPSQTSKNEEEKKLGKSLSSIRHLVIKPYRNLQTEDEKTKYIEDHPDLPEILEIIKWIDDNNISPSLVNARLIKEWMETRNTTKPPSQISKNEEEKKLGKSLSSIRQDVIKPYRNLQTEDEKAKYIEDHPDLPEILEIIKQIDDNNISLYLVNARLIKEWMETRNTTKPPSRTSKNEEEKKLGMSLNKIRQLVIKPYRELQTEDEKAKYIEDHPDLPEILEIVKRIDDNKDALRNSKEKKLESLITQDLEKQQSLHDAKDLEHEYIQELSKRENNIIQKQETIDN